MDEDLEKSILKDTTSQYEFWTYTCLPRTTLPLHTNCYYQRSRPRSLWPANILSISSTVLSTRHDNHSLYSRFRLGSRCVDWTYASARLSEASPIHNSHKMSLDNIEPPLLVRRTQSRFLQIYMEAPHLQLSALPPRTWNALMSCHPSRAGSSSWKKKCKVHVLISWLVRRKFRFEHNS